MVSVIGWREALVWGLLLVGGFTVGLVLAALAFFVSGVGFGVAEWWGARRGV